YRDKRWQITVHPPSELRVALAQTPSRWSLDGPGYDKIATVGCTYSQSPSSTGRYRIYPHNTASSILKICPQVSTSSFAAILLVRYGKINDLIVVHIITGHNPNFPI